MNLTAFQPDTTFPREQVTWTTTTRADWLTACERVFNRKKQFFPKPDRNLIL
jgi:hypothetical protein